jgi:Protein of unknown function, DUF547
MFLRMVKRLLFPKTPLRHARGSGHPDSSADQSSRHWIPVLTGMTAGEGRSRRLVLSVMVFLATFVLAPATSNAAPKAELWPRWQKHGPGNTQRIDHAQWNSFLEKYVVAGHASGINRVRYHAVVLQDRTMLTNYIKQLEGIAISTFSRAEQRAYWINLYNAKTVDLVLTHYPVQSIRDINISPGLFSRGPWGAKIMTVEGEKISLDDIEHRILRPIWRDNRVHYALNCASLGCPNLQPQAYDSGTAEALLDKGAREFVNHRRGVALINGKLKVSSIYVWFQEDFGGNAEGLISHWKNYAVGRLAEALKNYRGSFDHDYDWRLNAPDAEGAQSR